MRWYILALPTAVVPCVPVGKDISTVQVVELRHHSTAIDYMATTENYYVCMSWYCEYIFDWQEYISFIRE